MKTNKLVLCREIIAVCPDSHTEHLNALCGHKVEFVEMLNLAVEKVTIKLWRVKGINAWAAMVL